MSERRVEYLRLSDLQRAESNPKHHDRPAISASLKRFGYVEAITIDERTGRLVAGHGRLDELELAKTEDETPPDGITVDDDGEWLVPVQRGWASADDDEAQAYLIASNGTTMAGGWDNQALADQLAELQAGPGLDGTGYSADSLAEMLAALSALTPTEGAIAPDDVPPTPTTPITKSGDVWILGRHRLLCGSSTVAADVERVMAGAKAVLFATDPPYGVTYTGKRPTRSKNRAKRETGKDWSASYHEVGAEVANDGVEYSSFLRSFTEAAMPHLEDKAAWYLWHAHRWGPAIYELWRSLDVLPHMQIIWAKPAAMFATSYFNWQHEPCLFGWQRGHRPDWVDTHLGATTTSLWSITYDGGLLKQAADHPTQKPVEIFALPMRIHTRPGDVCFEPFSGSGSQLIAAEQEGRTCYAIELEPTFVDVACRRWQMFTGNLPVLESTGETTDFSAGLELEDPVSAR
jgi:DNA modification methylase